MRSALVLAAFLAAMGGACGPGGRDDGDDDGADAAPDATPSDLATITGTVWAPGNAPSMVSANHQVPVARALVAVSMTRPLDLPEGAYCEACEDPLGIATRADAHGVFTLHVPAGSYWLTIQKGQFRYEQQITVAKSETLALTEAQTTLPSTHDPENGRWTPRIALGVGNFDDIQDVLGKMGMGMVDEDGELIGSEVGDHIDYFSNGGRTDIAAAGDFGALMRDLERMKQYHIIFVPCASTPRAGGKGTTSPVITDPVVRQNIRAYVAAGGKFYVTDWSSEWADVAFPEFIVFNADHDTRSGTCTMECEPHNAGNPACCSVGDGDPEYISQHAKAADDDLKAWLTGQYGPVYTLDEEIGRGTIDPNDFIVAGNWNHISDLPTITIGTDDNGEPVQETAKVYVRGDTNPFGGAVKPLTVTFEPGGCGRVLYSTYHTADTTHVGLLPQERVLLYLIMEIGECKSGPIID